MKRDREDAASVLYGVHPVLEAVETRAKSVERILVAREGRGSGLGRLLRRAREAGIPISHVPRETLAQRVGPRAVHQGVAALTSFRPYAEAEEVAAAALAAPAGLLVVVDGVEDPRNLGAIVRTAAAAGADGVLLGTSGSVGLTAAAAKTSAGAVERIPVAREPRLRARILDLRAKGMKVWALEARGSVPWDAVPDAEGATAFVVGSEGSGVRRALVSACDGAVSVPLARGVESLNVSVALGVLLFEAVRRRKAGDRGRS